MASPNPVVAERAEEILVRMGSEAIDDLTEALEEEREAIRTAAARVLTRIRDTQEGDAP
jgi:HEAT repeat protein